MKKIYFLLILLFAVESISAQDGNYSKVRVTLPDHNAVEALAATGIPLDHISQKPGAWAELEVSRQEIELIKNAGLNYQVIIEDLQQFYIDRNTNPELRSAPAAGCGSTSSTIVTPQNFSLGSMGGFFTYQEMLDHLDSMAAKYPNLISTRAPIDTFLTHQGRPIYWVRISDNASANESEPEVFYNALHHAREAASLSQIIYYMWYLLENYNADPAIKSLVDNLEMYFVPCINPDGYIYNHTTNPNGGGMWRKNRKNNGGGDYGVDLNRNYGYFWGFDNSGSSPNPASDTYRGPAPFSEPETQAIKFFCEDHQFKLTLNYHTYGDLLIYPWGYQQSIYTPDSAEFVEFAKLMTRDNHYHYGTGDQTVGYVTNGDSDDWMYGEQSTKNKIFSMTPEAGLASDGFWPAITRIENICMVNVTQNLTMARLALRYAVATAKGPSVYQQVTGYLPFEIQRLGLDSPSTFTVTLTPLSNVSSVGSPLAFAGMSHLETRTDSFQFTLASNITPGEAFSFLLTVDNGLYTTTDTIVKFYGQPAIEFAHSANSMTGLNSTTWNTTPSHFVSAPTSITDSPSGNYPNNTLRSVTLTSPLDLRNATWAELTFHARWDIEAGYDYVQVLASTNNLSWTPLCGKYTKPGTADQKQGEPLYDGKMLNWVKEEMSLQDYLGDSTVYIRFLLRSDGWVTEDGFYFDELEVKSIDGSITGVSKNQIAPLVLFPNPAAGHTYLSGDFNGEISLLDQAGRTLQVFTKSELTHRIETESLPAGIYFIRAGSTTKKLVVLD